jgi:hypothetical protein
MVHVRINVGLTETLVLVVVVDMVVLSGSAREYKRERDKRVRREDCIAEEGGRDEAVDTFEVDNSVGTGDEESSKRVCREAGFDVADGGNDCGDGAEGRPVVENDRDCIRAHADEASHFVGWAKECPAEVVWVVYDRDLLRVVRDEEEAKGVSKPRHLYVKICFGVHRAGETGDVPVPGLVYRVERGE